MAEMILPDVYIDVRAEGLIVPGQVSVGRIGIVGTASKGSIGEATVLSSFSDARARFGMYDEWVDGASDELTLMRALQIAYDQGASSVVAVRVAGGGAAAAGYTLQSSSGDCVTLTANSEGTWGNELSVNVGDAEEAPIIEDEEHAGSESPVTLKRTPVMASARNRFRRFIDATGVTQTLRPLFDPAATPGAGEVKVDLTTGDLTFGDTIAAADKIIATYAVDPASAVKVTIKYGAAEEIYNVLDGEDLAADVNRTSDLVEASEESNAAETPTKSTPPEAFAAFNGGDDGASGADYAAGLEVLLNEDAHIILGAGQDDSFGDELASHCANASTDLIKRDRIAVVGSALDASLDDLRGHTLSSDRLIFAAPGIVVTDRAAAPPVDVTLPGAYAAAAVAGFLSKSPPQVSPTNKALNIGGLEATFSAAELATLVQSRVMVLEQRRGFRIVKGITTSDPPWHQVTTRRIVDYAKYGVRSAAEPYIGLLNNARVRGAMRTTINSFLADMVLAEQLVSYDLEVTATRDEERRGIARVTMTLRPTFSIDYIQVTIFLE